MIEKCVNCGKKLKFREDGTQEGVQIVEDGVVQLSFCSFACMREHVVKMDFVLNNLDLDDDKEVKELK